MFQKQPQHLIERTVHRYTDDGRPRHHDLARRVFAQVENALQYFLFERMQVTLAAARPNDVTQFFRGMPSAVILPAQAHEPADKGGRLLEYCDKWLRHTVKHEQCGSDNDSQ